MEGLRALFRKMALAIGFKFGVSETWSTKWQARFLEAGGGRGLSRNLEGLAPAPRAHSGGSERKGRIFGRPEVQGKAPDLGWPFLWKLVQLAQEQSVCAGRRGLTLGLKTFLGGETYRMSP